MIDIQGQIQAIEKEIRETPYHKGTEHHIGLLRAKLARLKDKEIERGSKKSGGGIGYAVKKQGDATVVLVGPPSAGKSTLINNLTNAQSRVAPYAFTTLTVIPGMMVYKNARIQILDVPGLIEGAEEGKGRGKEVLSVIRGANLVVLISDVKRPQAIDRIAKALEKNGIRLNKVAPQVHIEKKAGGGIIIHSNIKQDLDKETIRDIANEFGIRNAEIKITEKVDIDRLIDSFSSNRVYIPSVYVLNKADELKSEKDVKNRNKYLLMSADKGLGIEEFKETIWNILGLVRVYLVRVDEEPNTNNPLVMQKGENLLDVASKIGSDFLEFKTRAKIWGNGAKFAGQEVSLETKIVDGMQIRFI